MIRRLFVAVMSLLAVACGGSTEPRTPEAVRRVSVEMRDIAFSVDEISVDRGETIQFRFENKGAVDHDAFIGTEAEQAAHEAEMAQGGGDHGDHESDALVVQPGRTGTLRYTFDRAGTTYLGCHEPGHYAAGMRIKINVSS